MKSDKSLPTRDIPATELEDVPREQKWRITTLQRRIPVRRSLSRGPEVDALDPFETLAVEKTIHTEYLINHCESSFILEVSSSPPVAEPEPWTTLILFQPTWL